MAMNNIWTRTMGEARDNIYAHACCVCGVEVAAKAGYLVSQANANGEATVNSSIHMGCPLPTSTWIYRARYGMGKTLPELGYDYFPAKLRWERPVSSEAEPAPDTQSSVEPLPTPSREPTEAELQAAVEQLLRGTADHMLERVPQLVRDTLAEMTRTVEIKVAKQPSVTVQNAHRILPDIVQCVVAGTDPYLVGPAGSGKTTLCKQTCQALKRKFYAESSVSSVYGLLGYRDASGKYVRTLFREAFEHGGGFLLDEVDNSDPNALVLLNMAVANRICNFPDKMVEAHKDFFAIAAGNTYGRGADREYIGRNQLDAATLDRFVFLEVDYDEVAELAWAGNDDWTTYVQQIRAAVRSTHVRHVVSPRASIFGARLLAAGMERSLVEERCIWKGLDSQNRNRVMSALQN